MANRIRLGIIGANTQRGWAKLAHFPGLPYLSEYELTAVCTSKPKSADIAFQLGLSLRVWCYRQWRDTSTYPSNTPYRKSLNGKANVHLSSFSAGITIN